MNFSLLKIFALCLMFLRGSSGKSIFNLFFAFLKNVCLVDAINCYECAISVGENEDTCLDFGDNTPKTNCAGQNYCLNAYGNSEEGYQVEYHGCGHGLPDTVNVGVKGAFFFYFSFGIWVTWTLNLCPI